MKTKIIYSLIIFYCFIILSSFSSLLEKQKNDGSSFKQAILVKSVFEEYIFLKNKGLTPNSQHLIIKDGVYYDVFKFNNKSKNPIYFKLIRNTELLQIVEKKDSIII